MEKILLVASTAPTPTMSDVAISLIIIFIMGIIVLVAVAVIVALVIVYNKVHVTVECQECHNRLSVKPAELSKDFQSGISFLHDCPVCHKKTFHKRIF